MTPERVTVIALTLFGLVLLGRYLGGQMSFVTPAWVIVGDGVINQYHEGRISLEYAEKKLKDLGVPESMLNRLYEKGKEIDE